MSYLTNYQYYLSGGISPTGGNEGAYQYIPLTDIVRNYMLMFVGEDMLVDKIPVFKARFHAKAVVKELNFDAFKSIKAVEDVVQSNLKYIMPPDYVDYVRISKLVNGTLYTMSENKSIMAADNYLRDNTNEILFDGDGEILLANSSTLEQSRLDNVGATTVVDPEGCCRYNFGADYYLDTSKANGNPTFKIDRHAGVIDFDSTMSGATIVIEYISDGMEGGDDSLVVVNKFFEDYVYSAITYKILKSKYGIPDNTRTRARQEKRAAYHNARIRVGPNPGNLLMAMRGQNKWMK